MAGRLFAVTLTMFIAAGGPLGAQSAQDERTIEDLRHAILKLPYYGVFDSVSVQYERGRATVSGSVYQPKLRQDIVNAAKRVARVDEVIDRIEVQPVSPHDDDLRLRTFVRIYGDSVLSRYAPGGGVSRFDLERMLRYPGTQPFGDYPIRIIVKRGRITLQGVVDSPFDRTIAGHRAREVSGAFGVENGLAIAAGRDTR